jgi:hypothetical protein
MWAVVGSALAARRGQAVIIGLVALLASAAIAAAPWYAVAATQQVGVAAVEGTPVDERLITVTRRLATGEPTPPDPAGETRRQFLPAEFGSVFGGFATGDLHAADGSGAVEVNVTHREEACEHLAVTGDCPAAAGEVVVPPALVDQLDLSVGDQLPLTQVEQERTKVRVVGVYEVVDPADPYWGDGSHVGLGSRTAAERETLFTAEASLPAFQRVTYAHELVAAPPAFADADVEQLRTRLLTDATRLRRQGYTVTTSQLATVIDRIVADRRNVTTGVAVGVAVLLLFSWFTIAVVLRGAVVQIRGDVGWWRLHGVPGGRGWLSALGQGIIPLFAGTAAGAAAGLGLGIGLAGTVEGDAARRTAWSLALLLVGLMVAGGLVAVVTTQLRTLRTPVRDLIRRVPARAGRWQRSLVDLVLVVLAAAAVGQALTVGRDAAGLTLLAPGLAVLAIALVAAWAVPPLVAWLAARALRAGRLAVALVAVSMARRSGTNRLFALVGVAVALLITGLVGWDTAARTQWQRAALETGAERVVTVANVDAGRLLAAVRAADPTGTQAMAVVNRPQILDSPPVLAVDSTRLPVVAGWREEYGGALDRVAAALRPPAPEPVLVATERLLVEATGSDPGGAPVRLRVLLRRVDTGEPVEAVLGPLSETPDVYPADLPGCAAGCRLVGFELLGPELPDGSRAALLTGAQVELLRLSSEDGENSGDGGDGENSEDGENSGDGEDSGDLAPGLLAQPSRWRPALGPRNLGPAITTGEDGLLLTVPELPPDLELGRDGWVFVVDAPAPVPVVTAGWRPDPVGETRLAPLPGAAVPVEVVGTAALLPWVGEYGAVVDLEYAERLVPFEVPGGTPQVWLSASAPSSIVDDLRDAGLVPLREESLSANLDRLSAEGSAVGVRFQAVVALVGLVLAAGAVAVLSAQERAGRATELAALRAQGVAPAVVRAVGYGGVAVMTGAAVLVGLVAGLVGAAIARLLHPGFIDGWSVLPTAPPHPLPVAAGLAAAVLVLGGAAAAAAVGLIRRTRELRG